MGYEIGYMNFSAVVHLGAQSERGSTEAKVWAKKAHAEFIFYDKHYLPETIKRIYRSHMLKSYWRIFTLQLFLPFSRNKEDVRAKLIRYRVILNAMRKDNVE
jgi:hypothetical protein